MNIREGRARRAHVVCHVQGLSLRARGQFQFASWPVGGIRLFPGVRRAYVTALAFPRIADPRSGSNLVVRVGEAGARRARVGARTAVFIQGT